MDLEISTQSFVVLLFSLRRVPSFDLRHCYMMFLNRETGCLILFTFSFEVQKKERGTEVEYEEEKPTFHFLIERGNKAKVKKKITHCSFFASLHRNQAWNLEPKSMKLDLYQLFRRGRIGKLPNSKRSKPKKKIRVRSEDLKSFRGIGMDGDIIELKRNPSQGK